VYGTAWWDIVGDAGAPAAYYATGLEPDDTGTMDDTGDTTDPDDTGAMDDTGDTSGPDDTGPSPDDTAGFDTGTPADDTGDIDHVKVENSAECGCATRQPAGRALAFLLGLAGLLETRRRR
jgi:MYXO-CTERM domain-containing protein